MKPRLLLLLFVLGIFSCSKSLTENTTSLTGKWQLTKGVGGFIGGDHPAQDKIIMQLNADNSCRFSKNDSIYYKGTYSVYTGKTYYGKDTSLIQFSNYGGPYIITLQKDTLIFDLQVMCAYWDVYVRQKQ